MSNLEEFGKLQDFLNSKIIGQEKFTKSLLISLLADGHLLVEGAPGLAKTKAVTILSKCVEGKSNRVQFTPDLLPSDITGNDIYRVETGKFEFQEGPLFNSFILADEINRAPAKVQSALLEAMAERQITVGGKSYKLPEIFMVMATQNPIEQEGTYPLPEAQLDRFLMYVRINQPGFNDEIKILNIVNSEVKGEDKDKFKELSKKTIFAARKECLGVHLSKELQEYIVRLVIATRKPEKYSEELAKYVLFGASPRATIAIDRCSRINAWLDGRDYVTPKDVHDVVYDILRHRVILSFEAEANDITSDDFIDELIKNVALP